MKCVLCVFAQGTIKSSRIKLFLRTLKLQHYYTYNLTEVNGVKLKVSLSLSLSLSLSPPLSLSASIL